MRNSSPAVIRKTQQGQPRNCGAGPVHDAVKRGLLGEQDFLGLVVFHVRNERDTGLFLGLAVAREHVAAADLFDVERDVLHLVLANLLLHFMVDGKDLLGGERQDRNRAPAQRRVATIRNCQDVNFRGTSVIWPGRQHPRADQDGPFQGSAIESILPISYA